MFENRSKKESMNKTSTVGDRQFRFRITMITNFMADQPVQQLIIVATKLQDKSHDLPKFSQEVMSGNNEIPWRNNLTLWLEEIQATSDSNKVIKGVQKLVDNPYPSQLLVEVERKIVRLANMQSLMVIMEIYQLALNDYHLRLVISKAIRRDQQVYYLSKPEDWKDNLVDWLVQNKLAISAEDPFVTDWISHLRQAEVDMWQRHQNHIQPADLPLSNVPPDVQLKNLGFTPETLNRLRKLQMFMPDPATNFLRRVSAALEEMNTPYTENNYQLLKKLMGHAATEEVKGLEEAMIAGAKLLGFKAMDKIIYDTMEDFLAAI
jgi:hypothetical protein